MLGDAGTSAWRADWSARIKVHGEWLAVFLIASTAAPHGFDCLLGIAGGDGKKDAQDNNKGVHLHFDKRDKRFLDSWERELWSNEKSWKCVRNFQ